MLFRSRNFYPEIRVSRSKPLLEGTLRAGAIQILERLSRALSGPYLKRKIEPESDVLLEPRRLKLHLRSHKKEVLEQF